MKHNAPRKIEEQEATNRSANGSCHRAFERARRANPKGELATCRSESVPWPTRAKQFRRRKNSPWRTASTNGHQQSVRPLTSDLLLPTLPAFPYYTKV